MSIPLDPKSCKALDVLARKPIVTLNDQVLSNPKAPSTKPIIHENHPLGPAKHAYSHTGRGKTFVKGATELMLESMLRPAKKHRKQTHQPPPAPEAVASKATGRFSKFIQQPLQSQINLFGDNGSSLEEIQRKQSGKENLKVNKPKLTGSSSKTRKTPITMPANEPKQSKFNSNTTSLEIASDNHVSCEPSAIEKPSRNHQVIKNPYLCSNRLSSATPTTSLNISLLNMSKRRRTTTMNVTPSPSQSLANTGLQENYSNSTFSSIRTTPNDETSDYLRQPSDLTSDNIQRLSETQQPVPIQLSEITYPSKPAVLAAIQIDDDTNQPMNRTQHQHQKPKTTRQTDNYVKQNLRNSGGSCRQSGRKNKSLRARRKSDYFEKVHENQTQGRTSKPATLRMSIQANVDPLDDYLDGKLDTNTKTKQTQHPKCIRHERTCKLLTVKHNKKGNKGRKFYVCSLPKGEQCDFFQWAEDTIEEAQRVLLNACSESGFVARQVAMHAKHFKNLTLPELRQEAKRRLLRHLGTKQQVLTRLLVWARDQVASGVKTKKLQKNDEVISNEQTGTEKTIVQVDNSSILGNSQTVSTQSSEGKKSLVFSEMILLKKTTDLMFLSDESDSQSSESSESSEVEEDFGDKIYQVLSSELDVTELAKDLNKALTALYGYSSFRPGQAWAIRRCLEAKRSLLVAPTGLGKSLCYALPAFLMEGMTIVVSPLVSLIHDQLRHLPPRIPAATLSGGISLSEMVTLVDDIVRGRIKILFVSPEKLSSPSFRRLIRGTYDPATRERKRKLPHVSLLCVDEAHCLSQWGHNFRPSYLRLRSIVPLLNPSSILALTATAGPRVIDDICNTLVIPRSTGDPESTGVQVLNPNRSNIDVAVYFLDSDNSRRALVKKMLIKTSKSSNEDQDVAFSAIDANFQAGCFHSGSIIIYVWRRIDAEALTEQLKGSGVEGGVVFYHGGMDHGQRAKAQSQFVRGKARICVATVAFGMGINKSDVSAVIHMCLPQSPENYLQEIGRAGRDGSQARAVCLVTTDEFPVRHSLAHSDGMVSSQIAIFLKLVESALEDAFQDEIKQNRMGLAVHNRLYIDFAFNTKKAVEALDCKEETLETLLSLLEEYRCNGQALLSIEGTLPDEAVIIMKKRTLEDMAAIDPLARCIQCLGTRVDSNETTGAPSGINPLSQEILERGGTAAQKGFFAYALGTWKFSVVQCARALSPFSEPRNVFAALRRLQQTGDLELALDFGKGAKSIHIKAHKEALICLRGQIPGESRDDIAQTNSNMHKFLTEKMSFQEIQCVKKVEEVHSILQQISSAPTLQKNDKQSAKGCSRAELFQSLVDKYFTNDGKQDCDATKSAELGSSAPKVLPTSDRNTMAELSADIMVIVQEGTLNHKREGPIVQFAQPYFIDYTARAITKILHSIDSPRAPASAWNSHPLWGKWREYSFESLYDFASQVLKRER